MKLSEIENQLKKYIGYQEHSAPSIIGDEEAREETWLQVQGKMGNTSKIKLIWTLVAAATVVLFVASLGFHEVRKRDQTISSLQAELKSIKNSEHQLELNMVNLEKELVDEQNKPAQIDTVFKTKIVYRTSTPDKKILVNNFLDNEDLKNVEVQEGIVQEVNTPVFFGNKDEMENFKIEYGQTEKDGITPWTFSIQYN